MVKRNSQRNDAVTLPGPTAISTTAIAWILESVLVWQSAHWAGLDVSWPDALLVTTVAVAAQMRPSSRRIWNV